MSSYEVLAGSIIAAHGVQGAVKVRLATKTALALISVGEGVSRRPADVWLGVSRAGGDKPEEGHMAVVTHVKELRPGGNVYLVKIQGIRDRNSAEQLVGTSVFAPESRRAPLQEGEFFTGQLIGLAVVGDSGRDYGKIKAVLPEPANDVYETDRGALIPAVKAIVINIDLDAGRMTVADIAGLNPAEAEEIAPGDELRNPSDSAIGAEMDRVPG